MGKQTELSLGPNGTLTVKETVEKLIAFYETEAKGPGPLWAGVAKTIVATLREDTPADALKKLRKWRKDMRKMVVSCFYQGAANDLAAALRAAARWYVWTMDGEAQAVADKASGVRRAQNAMQTDERPQKIAKGLYKLGRYYIGTEETGVRNGWESTYFRSDTTTA